MKRNIQCVPVEQLLYPGVTGIRYETAHHEEKISNTLTKLASHQVSDFHITLYKDAEIVSWVVLTPVSEETVFLRNRYVNKEDACEELEERIIRYAENWAKELGYKKIVIHACLVSVPFYERLGYNTNGEVFFEAGLKHNRLARNL